MPRVSLSDSFMKPFKACSDVTGLEVGADLSEGVPAVRLRKSKGQVEMVAAGFLDLPGALPMLSGASEAQTWRLLRERRGWSPQRPARRAREQDDEAAAHWKRDTCPALWR